MNEAVKVSAITKTSFVCLLLFIAGFAATQFGKPIHIDTNLKDLSPQLTEDKALQHAVAKLSSGIENRFTLVISGPDQLVVNDAARLMGSGLSKLEGVTADIGEQQTTTKLIETLARYRFGLLTATQREEIKTRSNDQLVMAATERLYQLAGSARVLPIDRDPFGWFTDYLLAQSTSDTAPDESPPFEVIQIILARGGLETSVQETLQVALTDLEQQVHANYPGVVIFHSGVFFFAADAASAAKKDIRTISTVSIAAVITLLLLTFFSLRPLLLPFVSVATGIVFAFVVTYWIYGSIHVLTIVFGASLIGIIIDYSLHYFYCHSNLASATTHSGLLNAMKLSLVSSLIGYGALGFSDLVSLQKIAVFSCAGLLAAWVTVLATANTLMGRGVTINPIFLPPIVSILSRGSAVIAAWPRVICGVVTVSVLLLIVVGIKGNDNPREFFNPSIDLLREEKQVSQLTSRVEPGRYFVVRAENEEVLFNRLNALNQKMPEGALLSVTNWLLPASEQRANYELQKPLFQNGGAVERFMTNLGLNADTLQQEFTDSDGYTLSALTLFKNAKLSLPPLALEFEGNVFAFVLITDASKIESREAIALNLPGVDYIDIALMSSRALKDQRRASTRFLMLAFLLVGVTLFLRYRNWRKLLMLSVPIGSIAATLLILSLSGSGITLFHSMALFLVLGLGMDYVIFVSELQNELKITLQAVFLSAVTSLLSFGLLSLSSIPVVHAFGITVLIGNGLNLAGSMVYASLLQERNL